jgi:serine protease AprX
VNDADLLPIKVVLPRQEDFKAPPPARGSTTVFGTVDNALRKHLAGEVRAVEKHFDRSFKSSKDVPAVAKVILKPEAVAKSHRPTDLFGPDTCPIIGGNRLGELYVSVEPKGLELLVKRIEASDTKHIVANLSTLISINPYTPIDVLGGETLEELQQRLESKPESLRVRLFRHASRFQNQNLDANFERVAKSIGVDKVESLNYADGLKVYRVGSVPPKSLDALLKVVGIQSLSLFPTYRVVRTTSRSLGRVTASDFPAPDTAIDYPLVGLIDTGTDPNNKLLQAWVVARHELIPKDQQDNEHGSFVGGLLVHGKRLNHNDPRFPSASSKIVDVVALDKSGSISEDELLIVVDEALNTFPTVKVWNLSLGQSTPCNDTMFSEFGAALDERAERHGVLFVVAAGNYVNAPFRSWPPPDGIHESDRICPPADAIRAITVGSIAHLDTPNTGAKRGEPSPFSRRGPGPAYLIKPELACFGGNCDSNGECTQVGVISIDGNGHKAENIGTSFANPLVSSLAANVEAELRVSSDTSQRALTKALMVHAAFLQNAPLSEQGLQYMGLGCPPDLNTIINCRQSAATLIFQIPVRSKPDFGKRPFPMPACLFDEASGLRCEIFMTLLYEPPLDRNFGIEYCRCNVNASLGLMGIDAKSGDEKYIRQVYPVPKELSDGYEQDLVKHGFKWSPLKLYHRKFSRGPSGRTWRLTLDLLNRSDFDSDTEQNVILIATIRGLGADLPVYNELVREMEKLAWGAQDLQIRSRLRMKS